VDRGRGIRRGKNKKNEVGANRGAPGSSPFTKGDNSSVEKRERGHFEYKKERKDLLERTLSVGTRKGPIFDSS